MVNIKILFTYFSQDNWLFKAALLIFFFGKYNYFHKNAIYVNTINVLLFSNELIDIFKFSWF